MSFWNELKGEVEAIEAKIEELFHHEEVVADEDKQQILNDAKADAAQVKAQIEAEAPEVEADASDAVKNAVSDLRSTVVNVVENPSNAVQDLEHAGQELEQQETPAVEQLAHDAEADAATDVHTVEGQAEQLVNPGPAVADPHPVGELNDPEEGTEAAQAKETVDKLKSDFEESQKNLPEPAEDAETPESFANRFGNHFGNANDVSGSTHQV